METFFSFINQYITLSNETKSYIEEIALKETHNKGHLLLEEGKTCKHIYFIEKGTARTFFYLKGKDITHWIYLENALLTSWSSFVLQKPSAEYIELTSNTEVLSFSYKQWQELFIKFPEMERFGRLVFQEQIALIDDFYKGYYFLSAKEKYELLIAAFPKILQQVNLGHIASMLGITQETLSRVRGK